MANVSIVLEILYVRLKVNRRATLRVWCTAILSAPAGRSCSRRSSMRYAHGAFAMACRRCARAVECPTRQSWRRCTDEVPYDEDRRQRSRPFCCGRCRYRKTVMGPPSSNQSGSRASMEFGSGSPKDRLLAGRLPARPYPVYRFDEATGVLVVRTSPDGRSASRRRVSWRFS